MPTKVTTVRKPWTEGLFEAASMMMSVMQAEKARTKAIETEKRQKALDAYGIFTKKAETTGIITPEDQTKINILSDYLLKDIPGLQMPSTGAGAATGPTLSPETTTAPETPVGVSPQSFLSMVGEGQGREGAINAPVSQGPTGLPATSREDLLRTQKVVGAGIPVSTETPIRSFKDYLDGVVAEKRQAYNMKPGETFVGKNMKDFAEEATRRRQKDIDDLMTRQRGQAAQVAELRRTMVLEKMRQESAQEKMARSESARKEKYFAYKMMEKMGQPITPEQKAFMETYEGSLPGVLGISAKMEGVDTEALVNSVVRGNESIEGVKNAFGIPVQARVQSAIASRYPKFSFIKSDANKRYLMSPANLRSAGLAAAAYPRVESLYKKAEAMGNKAPQVINLAWNEARKQLGNVEVVDYETMMKDIVQEVNTALTGSSTASDYRMQVSIDNLKSANTLAQKQVAVKNLLSALQARMDASTNPMYSTPEIMGLINFAGGNEAENRRKFNGWYSEAVSLNPDAKPEELVQYYNKTHRVKR
jgi:hypothetical protein